MDLYLKRIGQVCYSISLIPIFIGLYKLLCYENSKYSFQESTNAYVGGDAYNYIINAGQATAYFVLGLIFVLIGSTAFIAYCLKGSSENISINSGELVDDVSNKDLKEDYTTIDSNIGICSNCKKPNEIEDKFCGYCGFQLD